MTNIVKLDNNRIILIQGDCLQEMKRIKPNSIDMVFADIPYGTTKNSYDKIPLDLKRLWEYLEIVGTDHCAYVLTAMAPFNYTLGASNLAKYRSEWIWEKSKATGHRAVNTLPLIAHESVLVFGTSTITYNPQKTPGKPYISPYSKVGNNYADNQADAYNSGSIRYDNVTGDRYPRTVLKIKDAYYTEEHLHPNQKPLELLEYFIKTYSNKGDTVLDPTFGSCTTGAACIKLGRKFIGIELDETYFNIGVNRLENAIKVRDENPTRIPANSD